jgi:excisionase family DNA binding protein
VDPQARPASVIELMVSAHDLRALPALLTVTETAELLRVGRSWVYEHAAELGAVKLGRGQTAPLRIPRDGVRQIVGMPQTPPERRSVPARLRGEATTSDSALRARPRL